MLQALHLVYGLVCGIPSYTVDYVEVRDFFVIWAFWK